jgi:hypothetical protein
MGRRGIHAGLWWRNPRGKRPLERPEWVDNIKIDLRVE